MDESMKPDKQSSPEQSAIRKLLLAQPFSDLRSVTLVPWADRQPPPPSGDRTNLAAKLLS